MSIASPEIRVMAKGETNAIVIDWGVKTAGSETGVLKAGDTVSSCTVAVDSKPSGASDPTLGSVTAPASTGYVNGRNCAIGEWTQCSIVTGSSQTVGIYRLKFTATTTNGKVIPRFVKIEVKVPV